MNPAPLYLLAPLALFLVTLVLYRISPLQAVAAGHARWFILPAFTLFILLIVINGAADPALRSPAFHWLMPGFGFALSLFPALPKALVPRLAIKEGAFAALGLMLMSLAMVY
ncbi:hypothetical protein [Aeromonas caviae]|uniref:hypothetical protein n=1 Tax=Aeromonas caviae TaxID=648 RepID=UPI0008526A2C|nr:hypothetical protein [Aeromonas caviae]MCX4048390.1 hypothetical protein [Aeromonas caviae]MCX4107676.1 hypothetical protein [Aeromonas caviae]MDU7777987.1 hypothetical protein [Aeromonas caviae]MDX7948011.1 hypothetical protein [Aeromonas caviae]OEG07230.1 hypothetical protein BFG06_14140 [Aeromonas caviae]